MVVKILKKSAVPLRSVGVISIKAIEPAGG